jgi:methionine-rich copper-binding protein CopC
MHTWTHPGEGSLRLQRRPTPSWLLALMAVLLALPLAVIIAAPASAHTKLLTSSPAMMQSLTAPPTQVTLTFNEEPRSVTSVKAQNTNGPLVATGDPVLKGSTITVSWPQDQAPGIYRLAYLIVSDDGDPVEGYLVFSYLAAAPVASAPSASTSQVAAAPVASAPPASTSLAATQTAVVSTAPEMGRIWIVGVVIVGLAALALLLQTRRRQPSVELLDAVALDRETTEV